MTSAINRDVRTIRGRVDTAAMQPIARGRYDQYAVVQQVFSMTRPTV